MGSTDAASAAHNCDCGHFISPKNISPAAGGHSHSVYIAAVLEIVFIATGRGGLGVLSGSDSKICR